MTELPGHNGKLASDINLIEGSFKLNFQAAIKFVIISVKLILPKVWIDGLSGPRQESDVRYKFQSKPIL